MNPSIRSQDDFFRHVNGDWLAGFEMPLDKSSYGAFDELDERSENALKLIIEELSAASLPEDDDRRRIANLYRAFMDVGRIEALGLRPLAEDLAAIDAIRSKTDLGPYFARARARGVGTPIGFRIDQDGKDATAHIAHLSQSGLGLPDRLYYFEADERTAEVRRRYAEYTTTLLSLSGEERAGAKSDSVFALEKALAQHHWTRAARRDRDKTYNKTAIGRLGEAAPEVDWPAFLRAVGLRSEESHVIVSHPSYFAGFSQVLAEQPLESWRLYLKTRLLDASAPFLPAPFDEAHFAYHGRALNGQPQNRPRWKRGVALVNEVLGEQIGRLYVERHFPESARARVRHMVERLSAAYRERLRKLDWLGEKTKEKALEKLGKFRAKIGHPDRWRDYSSLRVEPDDLLGNIRRARLFEHSYRLAKLGRPVDRDEWGILPQTVNAYYSASMNEIVFPAAILQPPFFDPGADDAANYGAIGAIIGHELSHGFDDQGSKSDGGGILRDWWTPQDRAEFDARTVRLVEQFGAFEPLPGRRIDGRLTLGENIADLAGLTIAFHAYRSARADAGEAAGDGADGPRRFFHGWARAWRTATRDEALGVALGVDPHSPAEYRVNGIVRNMPEFHAAFDVKAGDKLFLPEKDRVRIW